MSRKAYTTESREERLRYFGVMGALLFRAEDPGRLPKRYRIFTRLLRDLYDFPHSVCHTLQRQGE
jgi:hypothetical protein